MAWQAISGSVPQFEDSNGVPASGYVLKFYRAGTTTNISLATDNTGATQVTSVALNASGYPEQSSNVIIPHLEEDYKMALYATQAAADADSGALWTIDNISIGSPATEQFVDSGVTPIFASSTSFTIENTDATSDFHIGRRLKLSDSGGTDYATITASSYSSPDTTVTVSVDGGGSLDAGLSAVDLSILTATNAAIPSVAISGNDWTFTGSITIGDDLNAQGNNIDNAGVVFLNEQAAAGADVAGDGQFWVKDETPNVGMFTDDAGTDHQVHTVLGTESATTSGTSVTISSIPAWVKEIDVFLDQVSTNGVDPLVLTIGDSGGLETSGYLSRAITHAATSHTDLQATAHYILQVANAAAFNNTGIYKLRLIDRSNNTWSIEGNLANVAANDNSLCTSVGVKSLSATLDRISLTTSGGTDTFDNGALNIIYR